MTSGAWFPIRPGMLPAVGGADAWAPADLSVFTPADLAEAGTPLPTAEELLAAEQAAAEARAEAEREQLVSRSYGEGYADGEAAGRAAEQARLADAIAAAEGALDLLRAGEERWSGQLEDNVCALATAIARQIIGRELTGDAAALTDLVRRGLAEFPIDQPVSIRVNPMDLATLATAHPTADAPGGTAGVAPNRETRWVADPALVAGGCMIEGRERIVDGRVDLALERVYRKLTGNNA